MTLSASARLRTSFQVLLGLLVLLVSTAALARPGGGHSFSGGRSSGGRGGGSFHFGGGGHSSGGGGRGDGALFVWLFFDHPYIGIPLLLFVIYLVVKYRLQASQQHEWSTTTSVSPAPSRVAVTPVVRRIAEYDPDFSLVLFEDFLYALYARVQQARGRSKLEALSAYVTQPVRNSLAAMSQGLTDVDGVVIGAMRFTAANGVDAGADRARVSVEFETNYTEVLQTGRQRAYYVTEVWRLERSNTARSRPPDAIGVFTCPNCGSAEPLATDAVCAHCRTKVDTGDMDWLVTSIVMQTRQPRAPQLTGTSPEEGTDRPTIRAADLAKRLAALQTRDAGFAVEALVARVKHIHREINAAWSARQWKRARPYASDRLFQMQLFWMDAYKRAGLTNVTENTKVTSVELVSLTSDRWYDAATVRVFATGLDYTREDASGRVVGGSASRPRAYSEYWTLIRGCGSTVKASAQPNCPRCGAELKVTMAGACEYCQAKITNGEFDWVLSRIEQDDVYEG